MTMGPDGAIWGGTAHTLQLWRFDPATNTRGYWNGLKETYGGNYPNLVTVVNNIYGTLVGGTSTAAPSGGKRLAEKAALYMMDAPTRKVTFQTIPVASGFACGARLFSVAVE